MVDVNGDDTSDGTPSHAEQVATSTNPNVRLPHGVRADEQCLFCRIDRRTAVQRYSLLTDEQIKEIAYGKVTDHRTAWFPLLHLCFWCHHDRPCDDCGETKRLLKHSTSTPNHFVCCECNKARRIDDDAASVKCVLCQIDRTAAVQRYSLLTDEQIKQVAYGNDKRHFKAFFQYLRICFWCHHDRPCDNCGETKRLGKYLTSTLNEFVCAVCDKKNGEPDEQCVFCLIDVPTAVQRYSLLTDEQIKQVAYGNDKRHRKAWFRQLKICFWCHHDRPCDDCGETKRLNKCKTSTPNHLVCEGCSEARRAPDEQCVLCQIDRRTAVQRYSLLTDEQIKQVAYGESKHHRKAWFQQLKICFWCHHDRPCDDCGETKRIAKHSTSTPNEFICTVCQVARRGGRKAGATSHADATLDVSINVEVRTLPVVRQSTQKATKAKKPKKPTEPKKPTKPKKPKKPKQDKAKKDKGASAQPPAGATPEVDIRQDEEIQTEQNIDPDLDADRSLPTTLRARASDTYRLQCRFCPLTYQTADEQYALLTFNEKVELVGGGRLDIIKCFFERLRVCFRCYAESPCRNCGEVKKGAKSVSSKNDGMVCRVCYVSIEKAKKDKAKKDKEASAQPPAGATPEVDMRQEEEIGMERSIYPDPDADGSMSTTLIARASDTYRLQCRFCPLTYQTAEQRFARLTEVEKIKIAGETNKHLMKSFFDKFCVCFWCHHDRPCCNCGKIKTGHKYKSLTMDDLECKVCRQKSIHPPRVLQCRFCPLDPQTAEERFARLTEVEKTDIAGETNNQFTKSFFPRLRVCFWCHHDRPCCDCGEIKTGWKSLSLTTDDLECRACRRKNDKAKKDEEAGTPSHADATPEVDITHEGSSAVEQNIDPDLDADPEDQSSTSTDLQARAHHVFQAQCRFCPLNYQTAEEHFARLTEVEKTDIAGIQKDVIKAFFIRLKTCFRCYHGRRCCSCGGVTKGGKRTSSTGDVVCIACYAANMRQAKKEKEAAGEKPRAPSLPEPARQPRAPSLTEPARQPPAPTNRPVRLARGAYGEDQCQFCHTDRTTAELHFSCLTIEERSVIARGNAMSHYKGFFPGFHMCFTCYHERPCDDCGEIKRGVMYNSSTRNKYVCVSCHWVQVKRARGGEARSPKNLGATLEAVFSHEEDLEMELDIDPDLAAYGGVRSPADATFEAVFSHEEDFEMELNIDPDLDADPDEQPSTSTSRKRKVMTLAEVNWDEQCRFCSTDRYTAEQRFNLLTEVEIGMIAFGGGKNHQLPWFPLFRMCFNCYHDRPCDNCGIIRRTVKRKSTVRGEFICEYPCYATQKKEAKAKPFLRHHHSQEAVNRRKEDRTTHQDLAVGGGTPSRADAIGQPATPITEEDELSMAREKKRHCRFCGIHRVAASEKFSLLKAEEINQIAHGLDREHFKGWFILLRSCFWCYHDRPCDNCGLVDRYKKHQSPGVDGLVCASCRIALKAMSGSNTAAEVLGELDKGVRIEPDLDPIGGAPSQADATQQLYTTTTLNGRTWRDYERCRLCGDERQSVEEKFAALTEEEVAKVVYVHAPSLVKGWFLKFHVCFWCLENRPCDRCGVTGKGLKYQSLRGNEFVCGSCNNIQITNEDLYPYAPLLDLPEGNKNKVMALSRSSVALDKVGMAHRISRREGESRAIARTDLQEQLGGRRIDEIYAFHFEGMPASQLPRLESSSAGQGALVDRQNEMVACLESFSPDTNLLALHRGPEAMSVHSSWFCALFAKAGGNYACIYIIYMHQVKGIECFVKEGKTDRKLFSRSPRRTGVLFTFHNLNDLVEATLWKTFSWTQHGIDGFVLQLLAECLVARYHLGYCFRENDPVKRELKRKGRALLIALHQHLRNRVPRGTMVVSSNANEALLIGEEEDVPYDLDEEGEDTDYASEEEGESTDKDSDEEVEDTDKDTDESSAKKRRTT